MDAAQLQFDAANPLAWRDRMVHGAASEPERLQAATREFEAVLLRQYLNEALRPIAGGAGLLGSNSPVYGYLITDALATGLTRDGVFGFSNLMQAQMAGARGNNHDEDDRVL